MTKDEFVAMVRAMRKAQKQYFPLRRANASPQERAKARAKSEHHEVLISEAICKVDPNDPFTKLVTEMAHWQQIYFRTRGTKAQEYAMDCERRVDRAIVALTERRQGMLF